MGWLTSFQLKARDAETRQRAALKLGAAGKPSAIGDLEPLLLRDTEWAVRQAAAQAMGAIASPECVGPLLAAVKETDGLREPAGAAAVREAAVAALGRIGPAGVPRLLAALADKHARVRECAIEGLGAAGGPQAAEGLTRALSDDRSAVRQAAAPALARAGGAGAVPALRAALAHKDPATRRAAAAALGALRGGAAVAALREALADRERPVRDAAVASLAAAGTTEAIDALIGGLRGGDRDLRQAAAVALRGATWTPTTATQRAVRAVLDGRFADAAAEGPAAVEFLVPALAERDAATRREAASALGPLRDPAAAVPLAGLLSDPDGAVRDAAVQALAAIGAPAAPALLDALEDRAAPTRAAAARALERIGESSAVAHQLGQLAVGEAATHAGSPLRIVSTLDLIEQARHAADALERLLPAVARKLPPAQLSAITELADVVLLEPGKAPGSGDRLDCRDLREMAHKELSRR
ncbi:MAG: hypothetical protein EHM24_25370 [Acidobacteria bacterium]|nr:MAG: hypothetical protein EHM24_25370 [Acidobacteriota bacterium]